MTVPYSADIQRRRAARRTAAITAFVALLILAGFVASVVLGR